MYKKLLLAFELLNIWIPYEHYYEYQSKCTKHKASTQQEPYIKRSISHIWEEEKFASKLKKTQTHQNGPRSNSRETIYERWAPPKRVPTPVQPCQLVRDYLQHRRKLPILTWTPVHDDAFWVSVYLEWWCTWLVNGEWTRWKQHTIVDCNINILTGSQVNTTND